MKVAFVDRDGTINKDNMPEFHRSTVDDIDEYMKVKIKEMDKGGFYLFEYEKKIARVCCTIFNLVYLLTTSIAVTYLGT